MMWPPKNGASSTTTCTCIVSCQNDEQPLATCHLMSQYHSSGRWIVISIQHNGAERMHTSPYSIGLPSSTTNCTISPACGDCVSPTSSA